MGPQAERNGDNVVTGESTSPSTAVDVLPQTPRTPTEAMRHTSRQRVRGATPVVLGIVVAVAAVIPVFGGDPTMLALLYVGFGVCAAACVYLWWLAGDAARFRNRPVAVGWYLALTVVFPNTVYFGIFSAGVAPMIMAIFFVGLSPVRWLSISVYLSAAVFHGVCSLLFIGGIADDPGLLQPSGLSWQIQTVAAVLIQILIGTCYAFALSARNAMWVSFVELQAAVLAAARRDVVAHEAIEELQRAASQGPGRLTGQTVGAYTLGEVLGRGGMGEVYRSVETATGTPAAVKVLHPQFRDEPLALERFSREARHAGTLRTPHVVRVLAVGQGREPFIAMELLEGEDLAAILRRRHRLGFRRLRKLVREVGAGLDAAAAADIIHRDIKPQNLLLADGAIWKILDFGIARLAAPGETLTRDTVLGTPCYLAPEQALRQTVGPGADRYGLAAVAYRALTGFPPHHGKDAQRILLSVVNAMPRRPGSLVELPDDVDDFFAIALARDPVDRFASGAEMADALDDALDGNLSTALRQRGQALVTQRGWALE